MKRYFYISALFVLFYQVCISQTYSSDYFGLKGDGKTDNTKNFVKLSSWLQKNPGVKVSFKKGIYLAGGISRNYTSRYNKSILPIIDIKGCQNIKIIGGGAVIKYIGGAKFGSFDPKTGGIANTTLPFYDRTYISDLGEIFYVNNSEDIVIADFTLDGNINEMQIGGKWGDLGYQLAHRGINIYNSNNITLRNLHINNFGLDGISIHNEYKRELEYKPNGILLDNVNCLYNGRQGFSWTAGKGLKINNSNFSYTGKGKLHSAPGAGLDIEPEGGNFCDDAEIINTRFEHNSGAGFVTDLDKKTNNVKFRNCTFTSVNQYVVWPNGNNIIFENSIFNGALIPGGRINSTKVLFKKCIFNDLADKENVASPSGFYIEGGGGQKNYKFENCIFKIKFRKFAFVEPYIEDKATSPQFLNNSIYISRDYKMEGPFAIIRRSTFIGNKFYFDNKMISEKQAFIIFENRLN